MTTPAGTGALPPSVQPVLPCLYRNSYEPASLMALEFRTPSTVAVVACTGEPTDISGVSGAAANAGAALQAIQPTNTQHTAATGRTGLRAPIDTTPPPRTIQTKPAGPRAQQNHPGHQAHGGKRT